MALVRESALEAGRLSRLHAGRAVRLRRISVLLQLCALALHLAAAATLAGAFPGWVPLAALLGGWLALAASVFGRFGERAGASADLRSRMGELAVEWEALRDGALDAGDAGLRDSWRRLALRQERELAAAARIQSSGGEVLGAWTANEGRGRSPGDCG